jgi:hypothetical protein
VAKQLQRNFQRFTNLQGTTHLALELGYNFKVKPVYTVKEILVEIISFNTALLHLRPPYSTVSEDNGIEPVLWDRDILIQIRSALTGPDPPFL